MKKRRLLLVPVMPEAGDVIRLADEQYGRVKWKSIDWSEDDRAYVVRIKVEPVTEISGERIEWLLK